MTKDTGQEIGQAAELFSCACVIGPHLVSAKMAKSLGAKYYFTGKPCTRGHVAVRYVHGSCVACKEEDRARNREETIIYLRQWRKDNPEYHKDRGKTQKAKDYYKQYYELNREKLLNHDREWREANPERVKEINKRSYDKHRDKRRAKAREKYAEDPSYDKNRAIIWRRANRKKLAEQSKQWRLRNPEKARVIDRNKKHRRRGAEGKHTSADIEHLLQKQRYRCAECNTSVVGGYHVDHIVPISRGGSNWPSNLQILCPKCNMEKHASDPIEFAKKKGRLL